MALSDIHREIAKERSLCVEREAAKLNARKEQEALSSAERILARLRAERGQGEGLRVAAPVVTAIPQVHASAKTTSQIARRAEESKRAAAAVTSADEETAARYGLPVAAVAASRLEIEAARTTKRIE